MSDGNEGLTSQGASRNTWPNILKNKENVLCKLDGWRWWEVTMSQSARRSSST